MRRLLGVAAAAGLVLLGSALPAGAATPQWTVASIPSSVRPLASVAQADATDGAHVWAVGKENAGLVASGVPLLLRSRDAGATWTKVDTGLPWRGQLTGVAAVGPTDVWAIGADSAGLAHVVHGNGTTWQDVAFPGKGTSSLGLGRIDAVPGGPAWILGSGPSGSVLLRASGQAVTAATAPAGTLTAVRAAADGSVWISSYTVIGDAPYATVFGGDGTNWFPLPRPEFNFEYDIGFDLLVRSRTDIWLVGCENCGYRTPGFSTPLLTHWDGTSWTSYNGDTPYFFASVTSISGTGGGPLYVTANGSYGPGKPPPTDGTGETIALRFDGTAWVQTFGTSVADQFADNLRLTAIPGTTVTLGVGQAEYAPPGRYQPTNLYYPRIERVDG